MISPWRSIRAMCDAGRPQSVLRLAVFVALVSAAMQFWLVARAGTDIPILDQWDTEGRRMLPAFMEGRLKISDFFVPHNEHRIVFTHALNMGLFWLNGAWDPFNQLMVGVGLRSLCVALIVILYCRSVTGLSRFAMAGVIVVAFIPVLDWHNVLWGFQSHVWFALGFSSVAILCVSEDRTILWVVIGWACVLAAMLSMGAGYLVPVAILGHVIFRTIVERRLTVGTAQFFYAAVCLLLAVLLYTRVQELAGLHPATFFDFLISFLRIMAWPHSDVGAAALVMNAPMALLFFTRIQGRRPPCTGEKSIVMLWLWGASMAAASAWSRGGGAEFQAGLPSRYVDFIVLIPLANFWVLLAGMRFVMGKTKKRTRMAVIVWVIFASIGWGGVTLPLVRGIILPRIRDREAPVRLAVSYQYTRDRNIFIGQPKFYVPHSDLNNVDLVLNDTRLAGRLPPSFQPDKELGWLSALTRFGQQYSGCISLGLFLAALGVLILGKQSDSPKNTTCGAVR